MQIRALISRRQHNKQVKNIKEKTEILGLEMRFFEGVFSGYSHWNFPKPLSIFLKSNGAYMEPVVPPLPMLRVELVMVVVLPDASQ